MDENLKAWLDERKIDSLDDLKRYMTINFLGSITSHNVRNSVDLTESQVDCMAQYYYATNDSENPINSILYQLEQFEQWSFDRGLNGTYVRDNWNFYSNVPYSEYHR